MSEDTDDKLISKTKHLRKRRGKGEAKNPNSR